MSEIFDLNESLVKDENVIVANSAADVATLRTETIFDMIDVKNYSCWFKLQRIVAMLKSFATKDKKVTPALMKKARRLLLLQMMPETRKMLKTRKCSDLLISTESDGMVNVISRAKNNSYNDDKLTTLALS